MHYPFYGISDDSDWPLVGRAVDYFSNNGDELTSTQVLLLHLSCTQWSPMAQVITYGHGWG